MGVLCFFFVFFYVNAARAIKTGCCLHLVFVFVLGKLFSFFGNAWVALFIFFSLDF
jgi:hypothetical protein